MKRVEKIVREIKKSWESFANKVGRVRRGSRLSRFFRLVLESSWEKQKKSGGVLLLSLLFLGLPLSRKISLAKIDPGGKIEAVTVTEDSFRHPLGTAQYRFSQGFSLLHQGVDLATEPGTPIWPVARGQVIRIQKGAWGGYGNMVLLDHGGGTLSLYAHLDEIWINLGQMVERNTMIGTVGNSGRSTGNHLHFQISQKGRWVNPAGLIEL